MSLRLIAAALCASASALGPADGLSVGTEQVPFTSGGGANAGSATIANAIANLGMWHPPNLQHESSHISISCYEFEGVRCQAIMRSHDDSINGLSIKDNAGTTIHQVTLTTVAAEYPSVTALDETNAIVCYRRGADGFLICHALHLEYGPDKSQPEWVLTASAPTVAHAGGARMINVAAWDGRGAPVSWQSRRALVCYSADTTANTPAQCRALSVTYPSGAHVAGVVAAHSAITIVDGGVATNAGYPGVRFFDGKSLTVFDHFNAMICYTVPSVFYLTESNNPFVQVPYWVYGAGHCTAISVDIATGQTLTKGSTQIWSASGLRVSDVSISAFRPKSGDPTRALLCWITLGTWTGGGDRERYQEAWNSHIKCGIITRQGSSFILTDSKRDSTTHLASAGASTETEIAVSAYNAASHDGSTATYVKDVTLSAIDEYNQLICWTYGVSVPQCTYTDNRGYSRANAGCSDPTRGNDRAANGIRLGTGKGKLQCRQLWITGYGSSTYNSKEYSGVASASGPLNVGIITGVNLGPMKEIVGTDVSAPFAVSYDQWRTLVCYTKKSITPNRGACNLVGTNAAVSDQWTTMKQTNSLWSFNAPVDCVNGYNCPTAPMTLAQRQAAAAGRRLEEGKAAWDNMVEGVAKGIKTALKAATDGLKTPETEAKDTLRSVEGLHAGMVNISGS